jgi:sulfur-oxidizing protein SoxY
MARGARYACDASIGALPEKPMSWCWVRILLAIAFAASAASGAYAQAPDPDASAIWQKVQADLFGGARIEAAQGIIALETPPRAEDAAIVPVAIRAAFPQSPERFIDRIWLLIDNNPSPIAAVFGFTRESGRAEIETRIRVEQYTYVRAIARTNDGRLYMVANYVKASGGCSAPAGKDAIAAKANLGKMRLRVDASTTEGQPARAQLMVSHPNDSGLAMDQVTRTYATPHFVRRVEVRYAGRPLLDADVDFSISENPNFRFYLLPGDGGELEARVVDNQDLEFRTSLTVVAPKRAAASSIR